jgi:hypothetical protein
VRDPRVFVPAEARSELVVAVVIAADAVVLVVVITVQ